MTGDRPSLPEARRALLAAGARLSSEGLVARTWGNLSLRISESSMLITPSGIPYADLSEDMLALVDLETGDWTGPLKPSGERGLHRGIYLARPDVGAIVHTHQNAASSCAAARVPIPCSWGLTPCAPYALPGTKAISAKSTRELGAGRAVLLANHGVFAVGAGMDEAFEVALALESAAADLIARKAGGAAGAGGASTADATAAALPAAPNAPWNPADLSSAALADGTRVLVSRAPYTLAWAERGIALPAVLDDLAQIVGIRVPAARDWPTRRPGSEALFVKGSGLISRGPDAEAIAMVVEKAARAAICGEALGGAKRLPIHEAALMRFVYTRSYAKRASEVKDR